MQICDKTNECSGIIEKDKRCPHHGEHNFVKNSDPTFWWIVPCPKNDFCPQGNKSALCKPVVNKK
jgi:hypothetical protein